MKNRTKRRRRKRKKKKKKEKEEEVKKEEKKRRIKLSKFDKKYYNKTRFLERGRLSLFYLFLVLLWLLLLR
jgi:hypothetical protein